MTDFYEILGVSKDATKDEIKSAFRQKARKLHPDVNKAPDAEEKFKELGKAYDTLMDDNKRATYDRYGEDGLQNAGFDTSGPFAGGFGDLNDIFNSFFGGMGFGSGRPDPNAPQEGDSIRCDVEITFEEAVFGVKKEIAFGHLETCPDCNGTGAEKGSKPVTCPTCGGTGQVRHVTRTPLGAFTQISTCPDCQGKGVKVSNPCKTCKGYGRIEKEKKIEIKIPAGVDTGSKIRISGEGDAGTNGGPSGDLYVVLHVKESDYFKRDGADIYTRLEISPAQAVLGDEIIVKTLEGDKPIQIPAGIQSGQTIKLKGKGVPYVSRPDRHGDHIIVVTVKIPTQLSEEEKILYKKLYEINLNKVHQSGSSSIMDKVKGVFNNA